jgi:hypothetical protein
MADVPAFDHPIIGIPFQASNKVNASF